MAQEQGPASHSQMKNRLRAYYHPRILVQTIQVEDMNTPGNAYPEKRMFNLLRKHE